MLHRALVGLLAGVVATGCMTLWELPFFRRFGIEGCLDWQINQHALSRLNGKPVDANLALGLVVHWVVGTAAGTGFSLVARAQSTSALMHAGIGFGIVLWVLLMVVRKPITGRAPVEGRHGWLAAGVSLVGHVAYGLVLSALLAAAT